MVRLHQTGDPLSVRLQGEPRQRRSRLPSLRLGGGTAHGSNPIPPLRETAAGTAAGTEPLPKSATGGSHSAGCRYPPSDSGTKAKPRPGQGGRGAGPSGPISDCQRRPVARNRSPLGAAVRQRSRAGRRRARDGGHSPSAGGAGAAQGASARAGYGAGPVSGAGRRSSAVLVRRAVPAVSAAGSQRPGAAGQARSLGNGARGTGQVRTGSCDVEVPTKLCCGE